MIILCFLSSLSVAIRLPNDILPPLGARNFLFSSVDINVVFITCLRGYAKSVKCSTSISELSNQEVPTTLYHRIKNRAHRYSDSGLLIRYCYRWSSDIKMFCAIFGFIGGASLSATVDTTKTISSMTTTTSSELTRAGAILYTAKSLYTMSITFSIFRHLILTTFNRAFFASSMGMTQSTE